MFISKKNFFYSEKGRRLVGGDWSAEAERAHLDQATDVGTGCERQTRLRCSRARRPLVHALLHGRQLLRMRSGVQIRNRRAGLSSSVINI